MVRKGVESGREGIKERERGGKVKKGRPQRRKIEGKERNKDRKGKGNQREGDIVEGEREALR